MTPSTVPLPPNDEDAQRISSEGVSDVTETAGSQVAANSLLLRSIMDHLDSKSDLLSCMLLSKEHFALAARMLYRSSHCNNFSKLWDRGCTMERLRIYADGVRTLEIEEYYPTGATITGLLNQYGNVNALVTFVRDKELSVGEIYSYKGRQVVIRGSQPIPDSLNGLLVSTDEKDDLQLLEIRSIGSRGQYLDEGQGEAVLDWCFDNIGIGEGALTWLTDLHELELPSVTFSLKNLETVLVGCPDLEVLCCSLDTSRMSNDEKEAFHKELRHLIETQGETIKELDVRFVGGGVIRWLYTLFGPPVLRLSGTMNQIDPRYLETVATQQPEGLPGRQSRQLFLSITDVPLKKVNPYEAAKVLRWALSPFCDIHVEAPEDGTPAAMNPKVESWVEQFRSILKTLQREDDLKRKISMSKGWKEMQKVPDGSDAREASGSRPVENAPDGGEVKTALGGGEKERAPTDGGVDSTVGGGDEPSLWSRSFGITAGELSTCPTHN